MKIANGPILRDVINWLQSQTGIIAPMAVVREVKTQGYSFGDINELADKQSAEIVRREIRNQRSCGKRSYISIIQPSLFENPAQYVYIGIEKAVNDPEIAKMVRLSVSRNIVGILRKCPLSNDEVVRKIETILNEWANAA